MNKYAYLIIANKNYWQLKKLIKLLDDSRNDIYLIYDKKSNLLEYPKIKAIFSNVYYLKPINIYWGDYSQIQAEINLFKASYKGHYSYYHLLSGEDLPLVNQDVIHKFFDNHNGYEFISYQKSYDIGDKIKPHLLRHYFNDGIKSSDNRFPFFIRLLISLYRHSESVFLRFYPYCKINFRYVSTASNWVSIDDDLVRLIIDNEMWIKNIFFKGKVVDELFIPTLLNFYPNILSKVFDRKEYNCCPNNPYGNLRYIEKTNIAPHPKIFTINDYCKLINARRRGYLFARKFDCNVDKQIIDKIYYNILK